MDTEYRLDLLEARNDLLDLISRYGHGFDHRDAALLHSIWREDAVLDLDFFGRFEGIDAIMGAAAQYWEASPFMHHWMANPLVSLDLEAGSATAATELDCVCTYVEDGTSHIGGRYLDSFVREDDGRWVIARRVFEIAFVTPMPDWKPAQGAEAEPLQAGA
jgi:ketosteroid isomerase-like protein